jgi:hypothetical protein
MAATTAILPNHTKWSLKRVEKVLKPQKYCKKPVKPKEFFNLTVLWRQQINILPVAPVPPLRPLAGPAIE